METFTPSLNWGDELVASAALGGEGLGDRGGVHPGGRWRCSPGSPPGAGSSGASPATTSRAAKASRCGRSWACCWLSVMIDVRLAVLFSYQSNDQFSALQAAFEGEGAAKDAAIKGFWVAMLDPRRPDRHGHRPHPARHLPDAAVHHSLARVAHPAGSPATGSTVTPTTADASSTTRSTTRISASSRTSTSSPPAPARKPTRRSVGTAQTLLFGTVFAIVIGGLVHADSVGSGRPADGLRCHRAEGAVLDGACVRVLHDGRRVLDRPPADPAVLPQRAHQRRFPLCVGAAARCGRGRRPLPRRRRRTRSADDADSRPSSPTTGRLCAAASRSSAGTGR